MNPSADGPALSRDGERPSAAPDERPFLYLSDAVIRRVLTPDKAVELAELALWRQVAGDVAWGEPRLFSLTPPGPGYRLMAKGCAFQSERVAGLRAVLVDREAAGPGRGGPPGKLLLLADARAGRFVAVLDEEWQHAVRTGAGVAVAARRCAVAGPQRVALVGAGWVAGPTVRALQSVLEVEEVRVCSRTPESRDRLAADLGHPVRAVGGVEEAVRGASLVVTATTSHDPLVQAGWLSPGVFVYAMGDHQELETAVYRCADRIMADDWEQCQTRADIRRLVAEGVVDPASVTSLWEVAGRIKPGRVSPAERIVMRSQGLATQDLAIASFVYEEALRLGLGIPLG